MPRHIVTIFIALFFLNRSRQFSFSSVVTLATIVGGLLSAGDARGQTRIWTAASDLWTLSTNWSPMMLPTTSVNAEINNGGIAKLTGAAGEVSQLFIGHFSDTSGELQISGGGTLTSADAWIGDAGDGRAIISGPGSKWMGIVAGGYQLTVGGVGDGSLNIVDGGVVSQRVGVIAEQSTSDSVVIVAGVGSMWNNSGNLTVGSRGKGKLYILGDGQVENDFASVGGFAFSLGEVFVDGANSKWTCNDWLVVGDGGVGHLTITREAEVRGTVGIVGSSGGAVGTVEVNDSLWTNSDGLFVGSTGTGTLKVTNQGLLFNYFSATIGSSSTVNGHANGEVIINGDSSWTNYGTLTVGNRGIGKLRITESATVENTGAWIGRNVGFSGVASGTVEVGGTDSRWKSTGNVTVAEWGNGTLDVYDKATAPITGDLTVSYAEGSNGKVYISGGAKLTNNAGIIAYGFGSNGTVEVSGMGSRWENSASLYVGDSGAGRLDITAGAVVTNAAATVGRGTPADGYVNIENSRWENSGLLTVGSGGRGVVDMLHGEVIAQGGLAIAATGFVIGEGSITGNVTNAGNVGPSSPLAIAGNYTQSAVGKLAVMLHMLSDAELQVTGNVSLGGTFEVRLNEGFYPASGESFDLLDFAAGSLSGTFSSLLLPDLGGSLTWDTTQLYTTGVLSVAGISEVPGDFSNNAIVDAADYAVLRNNANNLDLDYLLWRAKFGNTQGSGSGSGANAVLSSNDSAAVPEPASGALIAWGCLLVLLRKSPRQLLLA